MISALLIVSLVAGCLTQQPPLGDAIDIAEAIGSYRLSRIEEEISMFSTIKLDGSDAELMETLSICVVQDLNHSEWSSTECNSQLLEQLKNSDNLTEQQLYWRIVRNHAQLILLESLYQVFWTVYSEDVDDSLDAMVSDIAGKIHDTRIYSHAKALLSWWYLTEHFATCQQSAQPSSCMSDILIKAENCSENLVSATDFSAEFISVCIDSIDDVIIVDLGLLITQYFRTKGQEFIPTAYTNKTILCERRARIYESTMEISMNVTEEPVEEFLLAAHFYSLSKGLDKPALYTVLDMLCL